MQLTEKSSAAATIHLFSNNIQQSNVTGGATSTTVLQPKLSKFASTSDSNANASANRSLLAASKRLKLVQKYAPKY